MNLALGCSADIVERRSSGNSIRRVAFRNAEFVGSVLLRSLSPRRFSIGGHGKQRIGFSPEGSARLGLKSHGLLPSFGPHENRSTR
jgi:hypothetical protein